MRSTFSAARHHLEEAYRILRDDDELSVKSRQALALLIDALLTAEYAGRETRAEVIEFPRHRRGGR
jgi:hypothetical protein